MSYTSTTAPATVSEDGSGNVTLSSTGGGGSAVSVSDGSNVVEGTTTDANTVNTIMGRLTKIRDLLNATLAVSAATLPLPAGASTAAKQPALGTAGTPSADVLSIQGVASGTVLPVSAASLPLPTGAAQEAGHLATIDTSTARIPAQGQALAAASMPVVLTAIQQTALTPPAAITGFALEAGHLATIDTNTATPNVSDRAARQLGQVSQLAAQSVSATLQTAQAANANGSTLNVLGMSATVLTVNMAGFTGTVNFEASEDGTNFNSVSCIQLGTNTVGSTTSGTVATSINQFETSCGGLQLIRARTSSVSAGNVTVTAHAVPVPYSNRVVNANQVNGPWTQNLTQVNSVALANTNPVPTQFVSQPNYVALTSPAAATTAATDTLYTFSSQVDTVIIQNNTGANLNYAFDATATAGSLLLATGQTLIYSKKVTVVHFLTTLAQNVNGSAAANIVLLGEL